MAEPLSNNREIQAARGTESFVGVLAIFGLLSAIALPPISLGGLSFYVITVVSPTILFFVFLAWQKKSSVHKSAVFPFALGCMVCVASLYSWSAGYSAVNYRDFVESIKYFQFLPYLLAVTLIGRGSLKVFHFAIVISAAWVVFVGFTQISGVSHFFSYLYLGEKSSHIDSVISGSRITLTGSDPNVGGVIACFYGVYFFLIFSQTKKYIYFFLFLAFFYLCFMTQSRTALIAILFGFGIYYIFCHKAFFLVKWLFACCVLAFMVFFVFYLDLSYIYIGLQTAFEGRNNSLNVRFDNINLAIQRFIESPVIGMGPAKSSFDTVVDSEYALILQRYGFVGVSVFFCYMIYLFRLSCKSLDSHWGGSLFVFVLMSSLVMITNNIFSGYQLMSIIVILHIACLLNQRSRAYSKHGAFS